MLISLDDPGFVIRKLLHSSAWGRFNPLALSSKARIKARWSEPPGAVRHWHQIPVVCRRLNRRVSGDEETTLQQAIAKDFFSDGRMRTAISIGCGDGLKEVSWAKFGIFSKLVGIDLNPQLIGQANKRAADAGLSHIARFDVRDSKDILDEAFDVVIFDQSLHHMTPVSGMLASVRRILHTDGLLIVSEYVGPRRLQWTKQQRRLVDELLLRIPEKYRADYYGGVKSRHRQAGALLQWLNDPSEAVESDHIESELSRQFRIIKRLDYGGNISLLLFQDIAANFIDNEEAEQYATMVLDAEDELLRSGKLKSDFAAFVCAPVL